MNLIVTFIQILSSLITVASAYGLWVNPATAANILSPSRIEMIFYIALCISVIFVLFGKKIKPAATGRDKKSQFQFFGSNNKQKMK
jgi:hypothetical protein